MRDDNGFTKIFVLLVGLVWHQTRLLASRLNAATQRERTSAGRLKVFILRIGRNQDSHKTEIVQENFRDCFRFEQVQGDCGEGRIWYKIN